MSKNMQKKSWVEQEKYQLLLSYRLGAPVCLIAQVLNRSEKSVYRAIERFGITSPNGRRGRPVKTSRVRYDTVEKLEKLFKDCGLSLDPLFDKGFFITYGKKVIYRPSVEVRAFLKAASVNIEAPWERQKKNNVSIGKFLGTSRKVKDYTLPDLLRFMHKSGRSAQPVCKDGQDLFYIQGREYTPLSLLYFANKIRLQHGLEAMCVPGVTQD